MEIQQKNEKNTSKEKFKCPTATLLNSASSSNENSWKLQFLKPKSEDNTYLRKKPKIIERSKSLPPKIIKIKNKKKEKMEQQRTGLVTLNDEPKVEEEGPNHRTQDVFYYYTGYQNYTDSEEEEDHYDFEDYEDEIHTCSSMKDEDRSQFQLNDHQAESLNTELIRELPSEKETIETPLEELTGDPLYEKHHLLFFHDLKDSIKPVYMSYPNFSRRRKIYEQMIAKNNQNYYNCSGCWNTNNDNWSFYSCDSRRNIRNSNNKPNYTNSWNGEAKCYCNRCLSDGGNHRY